MWQAAKNIYHLVQAYLATSYYGWPSKRLKVIGVTGTDGKTSTTSLIYHILKSAGKKASMVSTVYAKIGDQEFDTGLHTTTPHSFDIQNYLRKSVKAGDEYFVLETTSHALDQNRIFGIQFTIGAITNITHEHLDYHKTYSNYVKAKAKLLLMSNKVIINRDDRSFDSLSMVLKQHNKPFLTYGLHHKADFNLEIAEKIKKPLTEFNRYNFLAAYAVCSSLGLKDNLIYEAMKTFQLPPGRFEVIYDKDFTVIVDFAHTPNAMWELLKSAKKMFPGRRIINLFGSAGRRDISKRPAMGEASGEFADITIITEDDPRDEDPQKIAEHIAQGLLKKGFKQVSTDKLGISKKTFMIETDRKKAIEKAIAVAQKGDVLVFNGKGHEKSIARAHREDPWSDKSETLKAIQKQKNR